MMWNDYLKSWIKNEKEILVLQEFFGYLLLDDFHLSKALLFKGILRGCEQADSKTARFPLSVIAKKLVGQENTTYLMLEQFDDPCRILKFEKSKLNIAIENIKCDEAFVKAIIINEILQVNDMYKGVRLIKPITKHIIWYYDQIKNLINIYPKLFLTINLECVDNYPKIQDLILEIEDIRAWALEGARRLKIQGSFTDL